MRNDLKYSNVSWFGKSSTIANIRWLQSKYCLPCGSARCPTCFEWSLHIYNFLHCKIWRNFQKIGWQEETCAWKLWCQPSILLFVLGISSSVLWNIFHKTTGNIAVRHRAFLWWQPIEVSSIYSSRLSTSPW